jgi:uncharacterized protein YdeI (YjbR/CyaY-like superfamily)
VIAWRDRRPYDLVVSGRRGSLPTEPDLAGVPPSASKHPARWKFDLSVYHPPDLAAWRSWLEANHAAAKGVWVVSWRTGSEHEPIAYADLVEEAICFGWIDSTVNGLDEQRSLQLMTPRKAKSGWTRLNRRRVESLEAQGRMTDAGRRAVEVAKANGWWTIYDPVEDLLEPDELAAALDASPPARAAWDGFPPSARKQMLWWVVSAARPETRATRVAKIVAEAEHGRRAVG